MSNRPILVLRAFKGRRRHLSAGTTGGWIKFVVPFAAGSSADQIARVLGHQIAADLKGAVIVDNKPGAGGIQPE
jgi:tripartite-type tricarboxylate transporter receptor subunit TctC